MSAKDAVDEVEKNPIFDSPNISSSEDEEIEELKDIKAEEQKKRETVDIDNVPIDEKDMKYRSADIRKKQKMEYFVNVEGAEARARAEEKKKVEEKKAIARAAKDYEKKAIEKRADAEKEAIENTKKIGEVNKYIRKQKKQKAKEVAKTERKDKTKKFFTLLSKNWKKIAAIIGLVIIVVAVAIVFYVVKPAIENRVAEEAEEQAREDEDITRKRYLEDPYNVIVEKLDNDEHTDEAFSNYDYDECETIYKDAVKDLDDNFLIARLYMNLADRYVKYEADDSYVIAAAERAYAFAPEEPFILNQLRDYYYVYDRSEDAARIDKELEKILKEQGEKMSPVEVEEGEIREG